MTQPSHQRIQRVKSSRSTVVRISRMWLHQRYAGHITRLYVISRCRIDRVTGETGITGATGTAGVTGGTGTTGATGATGVGLSGIVAFDPAVAPTYPAGQVVTFNGSTYITNVASPTGTPGTSPDYTLLASAGGTGATGETGITGSTG